MEDGFYMQRLEGRRKKEQRKESGSAPAASRLPQLRHVAPLEPVWPLYTSRSPDLGSSLAIHSQSTSGCHRSYYQDCCSRTTVLQASRSWSVPSSSLSCVTVSAACVNILKLSSHYTRLSLREYDVVSARDSIPSLQRENEQISSH